MSAIKVCRAWLTRNLFDLECSRDLDRHPLPSFDQIALCLWHFAGWFTCTRQTSSLQQDVDDCLMEISVNIVSPKANIQRHYSGQATVRRVNCPSKTVRKSKLTCPHDLSSLRNNQPRLSQFKIQFSDASRQATIKRPGCTTTTASPADGDVRRRKNAIVIGLVKNVLQNNPRRTMYSTRGMRVRHIIIGMKSPGAPYSLLLLLHLS